MLKGKMWKIYGKYIAIVGVSMFEKTKIPIKNKNLH
jgi:hypothetical protein